jgi:hypothetical protein
MRWCVPQPQRARICIYCRGNDVEYRVVGRVIGVGCFGVSLRVPKIKSAQTRCEVRVTADLAEP